MIPSKIEIKILSKCAIYGTLGSKVLLLLFTVAVVFQQRVLYYMALLVESSSGKHPQLVPLFMVRLLVIFCLSQN